MKRSILLMAAVILCTAAVPADAATRCVPLAAAGCDSDHASIASAVASASNGDTIRLASGIYNEAIDTDKDLIFEGTGSGTLESAADATIIMPPASVAVSASDSLVLRSLRVEAPMSSPAISLQPDVTQSEYVLDDVVAIGGSGALAGQGVLITGAGAGTATALAVLDSEIQAGAADDGGSPSSALQVDTRSGEDPPVEVDLVGSRFVGGASGPPGGAITLHNALTAIVASVAEAPLGVGLHGGDFLMTHSRIEATGEGMTKGLMVADLAGVPETWAWVSDSLITATSTGGAGAKAVLARSASAIPVDLTLLGTTAVAQGSEPTVGVYAHRLGSEQPTVLLANSVAEHKGPETQNSTDLHSDGAVIEAFNSSFNAMRGTVVGFVLPDFYDNDNVWQEPLLSPSFAPLAGSPLIDSGRPDILPGGDFDLAGVSRLQDGNGDCVGIPDIGAFEYVAHTCSPPPPPWDPGTRRTRPPRQPRPVDGGVRNKPPKLSGVSLLRRAFVTRKSRTAGRKRGTVLRYTLSKPARVKIEIERRVKGRRMARRGKRHCVRRTRRNFGRPACHRFARRGVIHGLGKAGRNHLKFSGKVGRRPLAPGAYRANLTATDPHGSSSAVKAVRFRVVRP